MTSSVNTGYFKIVGWKQVYVTSTDIKPVTGNLINLIHTHLQNISGTIKSFKIPTDNISEASISQFQIRYPTRHRRQTIDVYCRSSDPNGKAMLCQCLKRLDWIPLFLLQHCNTMVNYFYWFRAK